MIDPKVVFEPVLGRWRVEYRTQWTDEWQTHRYHHTLEEAREVAQEMTNNDLDGAYRVVDTQADMTTPRLSGPCSHGLHDYCLGARNYQSPVCLNNIHVTCLSRECTCDCHRQPPIQPGATAAALAVKGTRS